MTDIFEELSALYEDNTSGFSKSDVDTLVKQLQDKADMTEGTEAGNDPFPSIGTPFYISHLYHDYVDPSEMRWEKQLTNGTMSKATIKALVNHYDQMKNRQTAKYFCYKLAQDDYARSRLRGSKICGITAEDITDMLIELLYVL